MLSYSSAAALWKLLLQQRRGRGGRLLPTYTARQLEEEPGRVVADVARALEQEDRLSKR